MLAARCNQWESKGSWTRRLQCASMHSDGWMAKVTSFSSPYRRSSLPPLTSPRPHPLLFIPTHAIMDTPLGWPGGKQSCKPCAEHSEEAPTFPSLYPHCTDVPKQPCAPPAMSWTHFRDPLLHSPLPPQHKHPHTDPCTPTMSWTPQACASGQPPRQQVTALGPPLARRV